MENKSIHYTKYEKARIIGSRALQISLGAPILVKMDEEALKKINYDPLEIAKLEFEKGVVPIDIKRLLPKNAEVITEKV